jgi:lipoate-protein ligase A
VLHQGDLTYAMVTSGLKGDRSTVYRILCEVLIQGWRSLGVALHYGDAQGGYHQHTNCFSLATAADLITASGTKMIGSAQLRRGAAILQHGSMRLHPDIALAQQVFLLDKLGDEQPLLPAPLQSLADDVLRRVISHALAQAAEAVLNIQLQEQPLTMAEWEQIMAEHDAATSGDGAAAVPDQTSD